MTGWRQEREGQEKLQVPSGATHKEQLECRGQACMGTFCLEFSLAKGHMSKGPVLSFQNKKSMHARMLGSSQEY